jgi:pyruvate/2-oxoglutarate dehydrogenase complex dihydrolipoamide dehydrogenase (E3) component
MVRVVVIGGGPAGVAAAVEAASLGGAVTLVSAEPIGGRANWHSLVPSKVYLTAADHLTDAEHFEALGLQGPTPRPDLASLRERIVAQARSWSEHQQEQLRRVGVKVLPGRASFAGTHELRLEKEGAAPERLDFDVAVVASGSEPVFPAHIRPDGQRILAPRLAGKLAEWPQHLVVIGGGVTGAEFAYFFRRMGCRVSWVTDLPALLPRTDADVAQVLERAMAARGVEIMKSSPVEAVQAEGPGVRVTLKGGHALVATHAFIALGRRPDTSGLGLEAAGAAVSPAGVTVDAFCRTSQPHIYAVGDVTGAPHVANRGQAQARVAAHHALGAPTPPLRPEAWVEAVYTHPQVAQVGLSEAGAAADGVALEVLRCDYSRALKARLGSDPDGFLKLLAHRDDRRIVGAAAVGERAAEILSSVAVAMAGEMTVDQLAALFPAHPTLGELVGIAARGY